jgi:hypothetical protein
MTMRFMMMIKATRNSEAGISLPGVDGIPEVELEIRPLFDPPDFGPANRLAVVSAVRDLYVSRAWQQAAEPDASFEELRKLYEEDDRPACPTPS